MLPRRKWHHLAHCTEHLGRRTLLRTVVLAGLLVGSSANAAEVLVAVASNFIKPMQAIQQAFTAETGYRVKLSFGSSGKLLAQVRHGAPYDVFLSADKDKVTRLLAAKQAVPGSEFIYATGRLVLWSTDAELIGTTAQVLESKPFRYLAVADEKLAPYGKAAAQVLDKLQLTSLVTPRIVKGENISQTYQFVKTGNAELGFVALSQVITTQHAPIDAFQDNEARSVQYHWEGSGWLIPSHYHQAIEQYAVLLQQGRDNPAARALIEFLQQDSTLTLIRRFGYDHPSIPSNRSKTNAH